MKTGKLLIGLLFMVCIPVSSCAFELGLGASVSNKYLTIFTQNGKEIASLQDDSGLWPYLTLKTDDKYFGDSSFGYFYYGWYSQAAANKVKDHTDQGLPSSVHLSFLYAGATFFIFSAIGWLQKITAILSMHTE